MPVRIQRSRAKGWVAPANAVYVGRPTAWGNPFTHLTKPTLAEIVCANVQAAVDYYEAMVKGDPDNILPAVLNVPGQAWKIKAKGDWIRAHVHELRGKDLLCWCAEGNPCHGDVLLELAN